MSTNRPTWDQSFFLHAQVASLRATCTRGQVGVAVVRDNRLLLTGYNGAPAGLPHCADVGETLYWDTKEKPERRASKRVEFWDGKEVEEWYEFLPVGKLVPHCANSIHGEQNVIGLAAKLGISLAGATWYLWPYGPCESCERLLITTDPYEIVYPVSEYSGAGKCELLRKTGVMVRTVPWTEIWLVNTGSPSTQEVPQA